MATQSVRRSVWELVRRQHGIVTRRQLHALGYSDAAIRHRLADARLHRLYPGIYAVGRPDVDEFGTWMAAVLACGDGAALSHESAADLWGFRKEWRGPIEVSVPSTRRPRRRGIRVHRRYVPLDTTVRRGIPITTACETLLDLAPRLSRVKLERAVNEADKLDLVDPDHLRTAAEESGRRAGMPKIRALLDDFVLTDSELEQRFLPIAMRAGLSRPETQAVINGHRVDFYWPQLSLVVETDGLRYHRTAAAQASDRKRDQAHAAAGLATLRFTHHQVRYEARAVEVALAKVAARLRR